MFRFGTVLTILFVCGAGSANSLTLYAHSGGKGKAIQLGVGQRFQDLGADARSISSLRLPDNQTIAILYNAPNFQGVGLVVVGEGLCDLSEIAGWNDVVCSIRSCKFPIGEHVLPFIRTISAVVHDDRDKKYDLQLLPVFRNITNVATKRWTQGNEGRAIWETCLLDLGSRYLDLELAIHHQHRLASSLAPVYSFKTLVRLRTSLEPLGLSVSRPLSSSVLGDHSDELLSILHLE